jgi:DNA-binding NarL/FixJ family response regulator
MKALLIDDSAFILAAFEADLREYDSQVTLIHVETRRAARHALAAAPLYDFVLLDLQLSGDNGFDVLAELAHSSPATPIVVISRQVCNSDIVRALYLGAVAFVPSCSDCATLLLALRTVAAGRIYLPPMVIGNGAAGGEPPGHELAGSPSWAPESADGNGRGLHGSFASLRLTPRQLDVLALLLRGQSNKLIARALNLSVDTIKDHVAALMRALNVKSRTQAVLAVSGLAHGASGWRHPAGSAGRQTGSAAMAALAMATATRHDADLGRVRA